jgi:diadenosine tetraphosphatase ApaH/serine/threonine PP2A family protein phosphatase
MNLSSLVKESMAVQSEGFIENMEKTIRLLRGERGKIGYLEITERLVRLGSSGEVLVIGDLHGDLESLLHILGASGFTQKMTQREDAFLVFLGDYGDRGPQSAEIYSLVLKLKLAFPRQIVLLRGNHEGPEDLMASPHDLPLNFQARFKENWKLAYSKVRELFHYLSNAVIVEERYLMVHGGLSPEITSAQDLATANLTHPEKEFLEDLLWSDPDETVNGISPSPRGAGKLFGKNVTEKVLRKLNVRILIRGHEPCREGFKVNHDGKVLTLFSRRGAPYFNSYGAYLQLPLFAKFESAEQLVPWIHRF